jgi:hypothetical protein
VREAVQRYLTVLLSLIVIMATTGLANQSNCLLEYAYRFEDGPCIVTGQNWSCPGGFLICQQTICDYGNYISVVSECSWLPLMG